MEAKKDWLRRSKAQVYLNSRCEYLLVTQPTLLILVLADLQQGGVALGSPGLFLQSQAMSH